MHEPRFYRNWSKPPHLKRCGGKGSDLISFEVKVQETDLFICASKNLENEALKSISKHRTAVEKYIEKNPVFLTTLKPFKVGQDASEIIREMANASAKVGVGPMASIAGAIAEFVGKDLLACSPEIIVENGGDIFIKSVKPKKIGIWCGGKSKFKDKLAFEVAPEDTPLGICTSSAKIGPSLSFGNTDATTIIAQTAALADACATAVGNIVKKKDDITKGIEFAKNVPGIKGVIIVFGDKMSCWGKVILKTY